MKLIDGQMAMLPEKIGENVYAVLMINGGAALTDIDGEILATINNTDFLADLEAQGDYLVSEKAIYDLRMNVVCDLNKEDVRMLGQFQGTVYVQEGTSENYTVYAFRDGEKNTVFTYSEANPSNGEFSVFYDLGYMIHTTAGDYQYYNVKGELLITTANALRRLQSSDNAALFVEGSALDALDLTYYLFKK